VSMCVGGFLVSLEDGVMNVIFVCLLMWVWPCAQTGAMRWKGGKTGWVSMFLRFLVDVYSVVGGRRNERWVGGCKGGRGQQTHKHKRNQIYIINIQTSQKQATIPDS